MISGMLHSSSEISVMIQTTDQFAAIFDTGLPGELDSVPWLCFFGSLLGIQPSMAEDQISASDLSLLERMKGWQIETRERANGKFDKFYQHKEGEENVSVYADGKNVHKEHQLSTRSSPSSKG